MEKEVNYSPPVFGLSRQKKTLPQAKITPRKEPNIGDTRQRMPRTRDYGNRL